MGGHHGGDGDVGDGADGGDVGDCGIDGDGGIDGDVGDGDDGSDAGDGSGGYIGCMSCNYTPRPLSAHHRVLNPHLTKGHHPGLTASSLFVCLSKIQSFSLSVCLSVYSSCLSVYSSVCHGISHKALNFCRGLSISAHQSLQSNQENGISLSRSHATFTVSRLTGPERTAQLQSYIVLKDVLGHSRNLTRMADRLPVRQILKVGEMQRSS